MRYALSVPSEREIFICLNGQTSAHRKSPRPHVAPARGDSDGTRRPASGTPVPDLHLAVAGAAAGVRAAARKATEGRPALPQPASPLFPQPRRTLEPPLPQPPVPPPASVLGPARDAPTPTPKAGPCRFPFDTAVRLRTVGGGGRAPATRQPSPGWCRPRPPPAPRALTLDLGQVWARRRALGDLGRGLGRPWPPSDPPQRWLRRWSPPARETRTSHHSPLRPHRMAALLKVKFRQPSHEFTFGVGMTFVSYPLVLTPMV
jgi:hypothetical protein